MAAEKVSIQRDYADNYSVKEQAVSVIVPKYFNTDEVSDRTSGMVGFTSEQLSNISEDAFNTASVLFREQFPNRAEIPESIYSHASIFQLTNIFSTAASCDFILVLSEEMIVKKMQPDPSNPGLNYFYIDKNTKIMVEEIPFTLDYDIKIRVITKVDDTGKKTYIFSAQYDLTNEVNSISSIKDPYIKIHRDSNGYIALNVIAHQCIRTEHYETIINNSIVNYPVIEVPFEGKLAGFEVFYKKPGDTDYNTQFKKLIVYSNPITDPFCYYQLKDTTTLRLSFNAKDMYFKPQFNSELKIILYITKGTEGNFEEYTGNNIQIISQSDRYSYGDSYLTSAKVLSSSTGGFDQTTIDALQALTVESYRTANALTTEADLAEYFNNYNYRFGGHYNKFVKKRDDVFERIFSAFIVIRNGDYMYNGNTMGLSCSLGDMKNPENGIYMIDPGTLFTIVKKPIDVTNPDSEERYELEFYRDPDKNKKLEDTYIQALLDYDEYKDLLIENQPIPEDIDPTGERTKYARRVPFVELGTDPETIPEYLNRPCSFSIFKQRLNSPDTVSVFDGMNADIVAERNLDNPRGDNNKPGGQYLLMNPFLIRFKKNPNTVSYYMTYIDQTSTMDFTAQNDDSIVQFISYSTNLKRKFDKVKSYNISINLFPSVNIDSSHTIIQSKRDYNDNVNYDYALNNKFSVTDPVTYKYFAVYVVVADNTDDYNFNPNRMVKKSVVTKSIPDIQLGEKVYLKDKLTYKRLDEKETIYTIVENDLPDVEYNPEEKIKIGYVIIDLPNAQLGDPVIYTINEAEEKVGNDLRVIFAINDSENNIVCFTELYPTAFDGSMTFTFEGNIFTDDHITSDGRLRIISDWIYYYTEETEMVAPYNPKVKIRPGDYYKLKDYFEYESRDSTIFSHYDKNGVVIESEVPSMYINGTKTEINGQEVESLLQQNLVKAWKPIINTRSNDPDDQILIPMNDVTCKIYMLYRRKYTMNSEGYYDLNLITEPQDNPFTKYDASLKYYMWANEYSTITDPLSFIKPLTNMRSNLTFEDYIQQKPESLDFYHEIFDVHIDSLPMVRWNLYNSVDDSKLSYFMNSFRAQYDTFNTIITSVLRNITNIDTKLYNTYGPSKNFIIGESDEVLNTINLSIEFDIWFDNGTDLLTAVPAVKEFIKSEIETIDDVGSNNLFISNLMRKIEMNFAYVDHIRFVKFNNYDSSYQTIKNNTVDLSLLTKQERREYVPELIVIDIDDIKINEYTV